ncbi:hypothetical protein LAZ67_19001204 [Cordylochernes scorpioides]|uniref:Uncharacterized protein n=1 Tax=Cordylochernes scorpioides TaxID=51811 RepID=A0ABY6LLQ6_9ARAC|nr:hypothetical protein LAZ67_19001204 [Cordylochernes scorpioides]
MARRCNVLKNEGTGISVGDVACVLGHSNSDGPTGLTYIVHYNNPKRRATYEYPGRASSSTAKPDIHGEKIMLCIWWGQLGVVYYELLQPNERITGEAFIPRKLNFSIWSSNKHQRENVAKRCYLEVAISRGTIVCLDKSQVIFHRLKEIEMIRKVGNWVPYELKPRDVERHFFTCEQLLQRQKKKGVYA